jgi:hypothetical protein
MKNVRALQARRLIRPAFFVDQQRKFDSGVFTKHASVHAIAQADGRKIGALRLELALVFAQLRDVLAAEDSAIVPEKNHDGRLLVPKRAKPDIVPVAVGQGDQFEPAAEGIVHDSSMLSRCS